MIVHSSSETTEARRMYNNFKVMKEKEQSTQNAISSETMLQKW